MNRERGEVSFEAIGKTWTLKLGTNAMCEIEAASGKSISAVSRELSDENGASMTLMRAVFWGCLQDKHKGLSLQECSEIIDDLGPGRTGELLGQAFEASSPLQKAGGDARPQRPAAVA